MENKVLALIASFIAMSFVITAYFVKNKKLYLLFEALCLTFLIVSYFFTVQFFAMIGMFVALIRALTFYAYEKKDRTAPLCWSFVFAISAVASYLVVNLWILKDAKLLDLLCVVGLIAYAFIFRIRNLKIVRYAMIFPTVLSILFNALTHAALFSTLTYVFELSANLASIVKYNILGHTPKNNSQ